MKKVIIQPKEKVRELLFSFENANSKKKKRYVSNQWENNFELEELTLIIFGGKVNELSIFEIHNTLLPVTAVLEGEGLFEFPPPQFFFHPASSLSATVTPWTKTSKMNLLRKQCNSLHDAP